MKNSKDLGINFDALASDLKVFFEFVESDRLESGKSVLANKTLSSTELRKSIPYSVLKVVITVLDPPGLALLLAECEGSVRADLERARDLAQEHLADLRSHPAIVEILREQLSSSSAKQQGSLELNSISKISYMSMYLGTAPTLIPAVRVGFFDSRGKLLLDSLLDWDDLLYVSKVLADIAADEFQAAEEMCEARMLNRDEDFLGKLGKHIRELSQHVDRLRRLAPRYGVQLEES